MKEKLFQLKLNRIKKRGERYKKEYELKEAYAQYVPERKKRKVSNILLAVVVIAIIIYTIASFWLAYVVGVSIDSTLTTCFYTFMGSELFLLAGIKISKVKNGYEDSSYEALDSMIDKLEDEETHG